jgi:hypothetical protein
MIEKSSFQPSAISSQKNSFQPPVVSFQRGEFQPSAVNCQLLMNSASSFVENTIFKAGAPELSKTPHPCRIVCDETPEDFRLALCRTLCAGACPKAQEANP